MNGDKYPDLQGVILMKEFDKTEWRPRFFRLKDTTLYVADGQSPVVSAALVSKRHLVLFSNSTSNLSTLVMAYSEKLL